MKSKKIEIYEGELQSVKSNRKATDTAKGTQAVKHQSTNNQAENLEDCHNLL